MTQSNITVIPTPRSVILAQRIAAKKGTTREEIIEYVDALMADAKEHSDMIIAKCKSKKT